MMIGSKSRKNGGFEMIIKSIRKCKTKPFGIDLLPFLTDDAGDEDRLNLIRFDSRINVGFSN